MENTNLTPEQVVEKLNEMFNEKTASFSTREEIETAKNDIHAEIENLKKLEEKNIEIEKAIAKFEGKLEAINEKGFEVKKSNKNIAQKMGDVIEKNATEIKKAVENGSKFNLELKDTTITANYTGDFNLTDYDSGIDRIEKIKPTIMSASNVGVTSSKFVTYVSQSQASRMAFVGEAGAKIEGSPSWDEVSEEVKKIAGYVKVSKEMLEDLAFVRSEINNDLMSQLTQDIEIALVSGTGGTQVTGLVNQGLPSISVGVYSLAIPSANLSDVIRIAKANIQSANYEPTHVLLHPNDVAGLQLTKSSTGEYTYPIYLPMGEEMKIAGLTIISSNAMNEGEYIVGDFSKFNIRMRNNAVMSVGLDQDDFTRNMVTILAESRMVCYVKNNQKSAFVYGDILTDIALIDKP